MSADIKLDENGSVNVKTLIEWMDEWYNALYAKKIILDPIYLQQDQIYLNSLSTKDYQDTNIECKFNWSSLDRYIAYDLSTPDEEKTPPKRKLLF